MKTVISSGLSTLLCSKYRGLLHSCALHSCYLHYLTSTNTCRWLHTVAHTSWSGMPAIVCARCWCSRCDADRMVCCSLLSSGCAVSILVCGALCHLVIFCTCGLLYPIVAWIVAVESVGWFLYLQFSRLLEAAAADSAMRNGKNFCYSALVGVIFQCTLL